MRQCQWEDGVAAEVTTQVDARRRLPPGQRPAAHWRTVHYGRVPPAAAQADAWDVQLFGQTACGHEHTVDMPTLAGLPRAEVRADLHCVSGWSVMDLVWQGVPTSALFQLAPPAKSVRHVMAWAEYGYSANLPLDDFAATGALLATHVNGVPLTPEQGGPVRLIVPHLYAWKGPKWLRGIEYLDEDRRGFWEERGYHNVADPWAESRYSYQEEDGAGPRF